MLDEDDLALVTGMTPAQAGAVLDRLAMLGAIEMVDVRERPPSAPPRAAIPPPSPSRPAHDAGHDAGHDAARAPRYDPAELDEPSDLEPERKRRVLDLFHRLEDLSYYALLGVRADADKKQIKSAYYAIAPEFHPDKYFRKNLGSYKQKIEVIFARITLAHDVLTVPERRAEYDEYLEQTSKNRAMSAVFDDAPLRRGGRPRRGRAGRRPGPGRVPPPRPDAGREDPAGASVGASAGGSVGGSVGESVSVERPRGRRPDPDALAGRPSRAGPGHLAGRGAPPPRAARRWRASSGGGRRPESGAFARPPSPPDAPPAVRDSRPSAPAAIAAGIRASTPPRRPGSIPDVDPAQIERASEALRRRHDAAVADAKRAQLARHLETGQAAMSKEDYAGAANAYRVAASLAPDDPAVQATCNDALRRAASALADGYWKQAVYEEGQELWGEAALSYSKVCTGRPDNALAHERVAHTTLKMRGAGNARRAVEFARKAVEIDPRKPDYRVTLARAYAAAGLEKSANGELDRALELGPKDPKVKAMVAAARSALPQREGK